ncbi:MAG TPA: DUF1549 and DUF1553 domain-containing protein [Pirellulales bacterium]|nr:DUF1549 and DUF1553 domain-containing protein [Pirellulales bacterium]
MSIARCGACLLWLVHVATVQAVDAPPAQAADDTPSAAAMAARIDELIDARLRQAGVRSAGPASDAEFVRRAGLDLNGVIPTGSEVSEFLHDTAPDKDARLVDRLLANPRCSMHLAQVWSKMLLPADAQAERPAEVAGFTSWLRRRFAENIRYDVVVADLLTTTGSSNRGGAALFYTAAGLKPEELATSTAKIFLGVQIHCAQCHDHPFDHWKQNDFWSFAAFFARVQQAPGSQPPDVQLVDALSGEVMVLGTSNVAPPKYLGADPPSEDADVNRRRQLAIWLVSRDNPYFARVAVNRAWALMFGRGLVHPLDDFGRHNPPSHPEVLDELATFFAESGYDLKTVFRAIGYTKAYRRSSQWPSEETPPAAEFFAQMQVKTLTPEQLYDCLVRAARLTTPAEAANQPGMPPMLSARQQFVARFNMASAEATEFVAGIPQILALMNGSLTGQATDAERGGLLTALEAPVFDDRERVEALFLSVLSREPTAAEQDKLVRYVAQGGETGDRRQALGDLLWAMLNSPEFILNH